MTRALQAKRTTISKARWKVNPWHISRTKSSSVWLQYKIQEGKWQEMRGPGRKKITIMVKVGLEK